MPASSYPIEPVDPIDDELARLLADPEIRAGLEKDDAEFEGGDYLADTIPHATVRHQLGMEPPEDDPTT
jgi:hypothetical protein